ncbi:two-partner secretion domain-containing protein [Nitrospira sp. M1]
MLINTISPKDRLATRVNRSFWRRQVSASSRKIISCSFVHVCLISYLISSLLITSITQAQITTIITPDSTLPTATTVRPVNGAYAITEGTKLGPNLFHSFSDFHLASSDTANFLNPGGIENVLSRVTGGNPSNLFGTIQSDSTANLFFLNPNGIVFGPDAHLNIKGSFYVSTADFLRLGNGQNSGLYSARNPASDILTSAPPSAFGFLGTNPGSIHIDASSLGVSAEKTLSVTGGDIEVTGGQLTAPNGQIYLLSNSSAGEIKLAQPQDSQEATPELGTISLTNTTVQTNGVRGGSVFIRGGNLTLDRTLVVANTTGQSEIGTAITIKNGISINATNKVLLDNNSVLKSNVLTDASPGIGSGGITITAADVDIGNGSALDSSVKVESMGGPSGDISIDANSLTLHDSGFFLALTEGTSDSGDILLKTSRDLIIENGGLVFTNTEALGNAGDIEVNANRIFLLGGDSSNFTGISSDADEFLPRGVPTGNVGNIRLTTNYLEILNAEISTPTFSNGNAGNIDIVANGDVLISGSTDPRIFNNPNIFRGVFTNTFESGSGGQLLIAANNLTLENKASLQASTFGQGPAGSAIINLTGNLYMRTGAFIQALSTSTGASGNLSLQVNDITITGNRNATNFAKSPDFTGLSASTENPGNVEPAGNIDIVANSLTMLDKGLISTFREGPPGEEMHSLKAGNISIDLATTLSLTNGSQIGANTNGATEGGIITISAENIALRDINENSQIRRSAIASANFGGIDRSGDVMLSARQRIVIENAAIVSTENFAAGPAGTVNLEAGDAILVNQAFVNTKAENGLGGQINIKAENLIQITDSEITSRVQEGSASAGSILVDPHFIVVQNSLIDTSANVGTGGDVTFVADSAILIDPFSTIDTSSQFGGSGTVDIRAPIQNLGETIAPLPEGILKISALFAARCAAQKGGTFSSFTNERGLTPAPSSFLPSPLAFSTSGPEGTTTTISPLGFNKIINETEWKFFTTAKTLDLPQGCSSAPAFPS